jgi:hypothetical protein
MKNILLVLIGIFFASACQQKQKQDESSTAPPQHFISAGEQSLASDDMIELGDSCGVCSYSESVKDGNVYLLGANAEPQKIINQIVRFIGVPPNFDVRSATVSNAVAIVPEKGKEKGKRLILYNPEFLMTVDDSTNSKWGVVSVLCHEIGHHMLWHTLTKDKNPKNEIDADKYSGWLMRNLGASKKESIAAILALGSENDSRSHPEKNKRKSAILAGWEEADETIRYGAEDFSALIAKRSGSGSKRPPVKPTTEQPKQTQTKSSHGSSNNHPPTQTYEPKPYIPEKPVVKKKNTDFYIIIQQIVPNELEARAAVKKLVNGGFTASYVNAAEYRTLSEHGENFIVYVGPYQSEFHCGIAVEHYRKIDPSAVGFLVSNQDYIAIISGVGQVNVHAIR